MSSYSFSFANYQYGKLYPSYWTKKKEVVHREEKPSPIQHLQPKIEDERNKRPLMPEFNGDADLNISKRTKREKRNNIVLKL